jgi:CRISPR/Cas system-associated protein Csm6
MKIITTVGTSIFENYKKDKQNKKDTDFKTHFEKIRDDFSAYSNWNECESRRTLLEVKVKKWYSSKEDSSAEIASILKIAGVKKPEELREKVEVVLLSSDTVLSKLACDLIYEWFKPYDDFQFSEYNIIDNQKKHKYNLDGKGFVIQNLRISDNKDYEKGFMRLIEVLDDLDLKPTDVLNITGGYKAIIPIMTIYGQLKNVPLNYIYDESELGKADLIELTGLPINFDWAFGELYVDFLTKTGRKKLEEKSEIVTLLRSNELIRKDSFKLTPFGKLFYDYIIKLNTDKKGDFGYFMELRVFEALFRQGRKIKSQGCKIWHQLENNTYYFEPKHDKDEKKEKSIDIDILIENKGNETWCEVKSCSEKGLKKALKQYQTIIQFLENTSYSSVENFELYLYVLPNMKDEYKAKIQAIINLMADKELSLKIWLFTLPISNSGRVNTKGIFEKEMIFEEYQDT